MFDRRNTETARISEEIAKPSAPASLPRRALLGGAILVVPGVVAAVPPAAAAAQEGEVLRRCAELEAALDACEAIDGGAMPGCDDGVVDMLCERCREATGVLVDTPASTLADLRGKARLAVRIGSHLVREGLRAEGDDLLLLQSVAEELLAITRPQAGETATPIAGAGGGA